MTEEPTTHDPAELVLRLFEFVNRREWDRVLSFSAPDAVWDMSPLGVGTFEGPAAVRGLWEEWASVYEEWQIDVDEVLDLGIGVVLVVNHQKGRLQGSSGHVRNTGAMVFRWVDDKIARATIYGDIDEARAAAERLAKEPG